MLTKCFVCCFLQQIKYLVREWSCGCLVTMLIWLMWNLNDVKKEQQLIAQLRLHNVTYISRTMTMSDLPSKASTHWTSLGWWRLFMMPISCLTLSFSFAEYALMNFPAQAFFVAFSTSLKTWPNFPLPPKHNTHLNKGRNWKQNLNWSWKFMSLWGANQTTVVKIILK